MAICPYCECEVRSLDIRPMAARTPRQSVDAVAYLCSECKQILSVGTDPLAIRKAIVKDVLAALEES